VPARALLIRSASALLVLVAAALAAVGGVSLGVSGLVAVVLAAVVAACLAAGVARDGDSADPRQAAVDAAWRAGVGTVGVLLLLSGSAVLAGGAVTALLVGCVLGGLMVRWTLRWARALRSSATSTATATVLPLPGAAVPSSDPGAGPVHDLSVEALGQEWLRTSAALARVRTATARQALADRRREALDELERRDPVGFARWLAAGATVDSDPARYVSGDPAAGHDAGHDAA
jgi:hypothetical protein